MKSLSFFLAAFMILLAVVSCNGESKKSSVSIADSKLVTSEKKLATYEVDIKGMTCAIGCAAVIEKTLARTAGVEQSKVDFDNKKGVFTFDTSQINKQELIEKIEQIAGGRMYQVENAKKI